MRHDPALASLPSRLRRGSRARYVLAPVAALAALISAGCSTGGSAGGAVSNTITIAAVPGIDTAPLYLAQKNGLFAAEGLTHVVIKNYSSEPAELAALQNAQADIAASDYGDIFYAQSQSPDLKVLADGYDATQGVLEVLTLPGSAITSPVNLAGARVGVPDDQVLLGLTNSGDPISLDTAAATQVLSNYLGNNAESVTWVPMSQPDEISALEHGQLAAVLVSEPYIYEAESQVGAVAVLDACSGSTASLPLSGYVAMKAWVKDNPAAVADFQAAIAQAQTQASMSGEVQQLLPRTAGMSVEDADLSTIGTYPTSTSVVGLERVVRLMWNFNMLKSGEAPSVPPMVVKPGS
jgi:NitT/TauT family transport system substrate-binding protein